MFETKRKGHYNEWQAIQLARKKMLEEDSEDDNEGANETENKAKCVPSCDSEETSESSSPM